MAGGIGTDFCSTISNPIWTHNVYIIAGGSWVVLILAGLSGWCIIMLTVLSWREEEKGPFPYLSSSRAELQWTPNSIGDMGVETLRWDETRKQCVGEVLNLTQRGSCLVPNIRRTDVIIMSNALILRACVLCTIQVFIEVVLAPFDLLHWSVER